MCYIISKTYNVDKKYVHYWVHSVCSVSVTYYCLSVCQFSSVQLLSRVWLLWPYGLQHARPCCPSSTSRAYSNSCSLSRCCHPTISSSVIPVSYCLQSFLASGSFPMSQFFTSSGQSIGVSASASVLPKNIQDWFPLGWTQYVALETISIYKTFLLAES